MTDDPERYLSTDNLRHEIPFSPQAFDIDDATEDADGNTDWDNLLLRFLDEESARVEGFAGTVFVESTVTTTLYGDENAVDADLRLPDRPVVSVESVDADGDVLDTETDVRVRDTHIELLDAAPIDSWPDGPIEVSWTYGFSDAPTEVTDGVVRLVRSRLERIQSDGLESESLPTGQSASYRPPEDVQASVASSVREHKPDSYHSGAMVI